MQVVILAAGSSSRFYPFNVTHKACLTLLGKRIIEHTLASTKKAGFTDVLLVVDESSHIKNIVGDGSRFGLKITYIIQKTPTGAGDALLLAKEHIQDDFFVIWGNRVEFHEVAHDLLAAKKEKNGVILVKETKQIEGVGVVQLEKNRLVDIIEKPEIEKSPSYHKIIGVYLLPKRFLHTLEKTSLDHYSFEKALVTFAKEEEISAIVTTKDTLSLKYPWDILRMKDYLLSQISSYQEKTVSLSENVMIQGNVYIDEGTKIMENAVIKGPCYIGKNAYVGNNAVLRNGTVIEENVTVGTNMEIKNTVILKNTTTHSGFIGDSVIGENSKIAANFCTANVRLDREPVSVSVQGKQVNSHLKSLGVLMGNDCRIGIRVSTMPGVIIGRNVTVGPHTSIMHDIGDDTTYFTKFAEIIEKTKINEKK